MSVMNWVAQTEQSTAVPTANPRQTLIDVIAKKKRETSDSIGSRIRDEVGGVEDCQDKEPGESDRPDTERSLYPGYHA
jgi:hypothetical protein